MTELTEPTEPAEPTEYALLEGKTLMASFTVNDLKESLGWYRDVIGFTVDQEMKRDGKVTAVSLKAGAVRILLGQDDGAKGFDRAKGQGCSIQITTSQSIDEMAERVRSRGFVLETEPTDMPWGARVFRVKDPDGFLLVFASERSAN